MIYRCPPYYHLFSCLGSRCPDTCCRGWKVDIDEESLSRYGALSGEAGYRIKNAVDWLDESFIQDEKGCILQTEEGLCFIQKELGEQALCSTCAAFPRHVEEYRGVREKSISMSCPEAARLILTTPVSEATEWQAEDEFDELEYEDYDESLFDSLVELRRQCIQILSREEEPYEAQAEKIRKAAGLPEPAASRLERMREELGELMELEVIDDGWTDLMEEAGEHLWGMSDAEYAGLRSEFTLNLQIENDLENNPDSSDRADMPAISRIMQRTAAYFLYVYLPGAVYYGESAGKIRLAFMCADWLEELVMLRWAKEGKKITFSQVLRLAGKLARQVEHSDDNLEKLESGGSSC